MFTFLLVIAWALGCFSVLMSVPLMLRFRWSAGGPMLWAVKSYSGAIAPYLGFAGVLFAVTGYFMGSWIAILLGAYSALVYWNYWARIVALRNTPTGFANAFGPELEAHLPVERKARFLRHPAPLRLPPARDFRLIQNLPFSILPGSNRELLCDLWLPAEHIAASGLAFIYLHGGAWCLLDKDFSTRPFFRHLASQGHVIMDVGYRLFPETDMYGMVQDAKRAIAWMKTHATEYDVHPDRIVIGGGSAGGHLALLAAYLPKEPKLVPPELESADLGVHAVVALYGPSDLEALYYHTDQQITTQPQPGKPVKAQSGETPAWMRNIMGAEYHRLGFDKPMAEAGALGVILGCHPEECPDRYAFFSPLTHAGMYCPPTLIVHGEHDMFTPVDAARRLYGKLNEAGVPVAMFLLPQTDHGFDLFMPENSAVAHAAFYTVERFLALLTADKQTAALQN